MVHHNAKLLALGLVHLPESDDIRVLQNLQNLGLLHGFSPLLVGLGRDVDLLDHSIGLVRHALDESGSARLPRAESLELLVHLTVSLLLSGLHF